MRDLISPVRREGRQTETSWHPKKASTNKTHLKSLEQIPSKTEEVTKINNFLLNHWNFHIFLTGDCQSMLNHSLKGQIWCRLRSFKAAGACY